MNGARRSSAKDFSDPLPISEFQLSLWRLDTLHKVQNSLKTSLGAILDAKRELLKQIAAVRTPHLGQS